MLHMRTRKACGFWLALDAPKTRFWLAAIESGVTTTTSFERSPAPGGSLARKPQLCAGIEVGSRVIMPLSSFWANCVAPTPSSWSALRSATFACELTFMGAEFLVAGSTVRSPTCRSSAEPPEGFLTISEEPVAALPTRAVVFVATFLRLPSLRKSPLAPRAVDANPSMSASITERPTKNTVALPTHITLLTALLQQFAEELILEKVSRFCILLSNHKPDV